MFCLEIHSNCVFDALGKAEPLRSTATRTDRQMDGRTDRQTDATMCFFSLVHKATNTQTHKRTDRRTLPSAFKVQSKWVKIIYTLLYKRNYWIDVEFPHRMTCIHTVQELGQFLHDTRHMWKVHIISTFFSESVHHNIQVMSFWLWITFWHGSLEFHEVPLIEEQGLFQIINQ